jgi:hypothetical protein
MASTCNVRGGTGVPALATDTQKTVAAAPRFTVVGAWGVLGVLTILGNAIKRLLPVALEPFHRNDLSAPFWLSYGLFTAYMAYAGKHSKLILRRITDVVSWQRDTKHFS